MTPEQILVRQISIAVLTASANGGMEEVLKRAEDAIRAAIAQEREECAKVCAEPQKRGDDVAGKTWIECQEAIRARGNP